MVVRVGVGWGGGGWGGCAGAPLADGGFVPQTQRNIGSAFQEKHAENPDLYLFFFFWNGLFFMDGLKYMCRHLLSFLRSLSFFKLVGYVHPLWIGYSEYLGTSCSYIGCRGRVTSFQWQDTTHRLPQSIFPFIRQEKHNLMNLYCCNESCCTEEDQKKAVWRPFSDKNTSWCFVYHSIGCT